jgi:hypothetical protein
MRFAAAVLGAILLLQGTCASAESLAVRHTEGVVHGFLVLRNLEGAVLAEGELNQVARGDRVTSKLAFRFRDGSSHEETAVYSQRGRFRLLSDHVLQKGPSFPRATEITIDALAARVKAHGAGEDAKDIDEPLEMPPDIANGMISTLLKNIPAGTSSIKVPIVTVSKKPHIADLTITREGEDHFAVAGSRHAGVRYRVHVKFRGLAGVVAPILGKEPPDYHVWIMEGPAPVFLKSEGPLYSGGPAWRIELASPQWPKEAKP